MLRSSSRLTNTVAVVAAIGALTACGKSRDLEYGVAECNRCHEAPPPSGAHLAHTSAVVGRGGVGSLGVTADYLGPEATGYAFGCANCHEVGGVHGTGRIVLSSAGAPAGSLKARNAPDAAYDEVAGTCSGVYCHSSGQESPTYATTPAWTSATTLGCGDCHGNPPRYASGGAGAADANSHLGLITEAGTTYETGHFAGFPAMVHVTSGLGIPDSHGTPITCQSCHYETTDASNTGPSGFYYLDTSGDYDMGGTGSFCFGGTDETCTGGTLSASYACTQCHDAASSTAPTGTGKVRPYFHVNGVRDVDLDPRPTGVAPFARPYGYLSPGVNAPTSYWAVGGDALVDAGNDTLTFRLQSASWDPSTKTCSSVACHFQRTSVQWGEPLVNAGLPVGTCSVCHDK